MEKNMKIISVYIQNFQGIKELRVDTNADIIIIQGDKGSGKTIFLDAIYFCLMGRKRNILAYNDCGQDTKICLTILKNNREYRLEVVVKHIGEDRGCFYKVYDKTGEIAYKFHDYLEFIKKYLLNNSFYSENFIDCNYYSGKYRHKINSFNSKEQEINEVAKKYSFPIAGLKLVFNNDCTADLFKEDNSLYLGGFYSSGENALRNLTSDLVIVKYLEEVQQCEANPIFIDDGFCMISMPYVSQMCKYLEKFENQMFLTCFKMDSLNFEKKKITKLDLDKLLIS